MPVGSQSRRASIYLATGNINVHDDNNKSLIISPSSTLNKTITQPSTPIIMNGGNMIATGSGISPLINPFDTVMANNNNNDTGSLSIDHSLALPTNRFISTNKRVLDETDIDQWFPDKESSINIIKNNNNVQLNFNNNNKKADSSIESVDFSIETQHGQHNTITTNSKCAKIVNNKQNFSSQMLPSPKMISSDIVDNVFETKEPRTKNKPKLYQPTQSDGWFVSIF